MPSTILHAPAPSSGTAHLPAASTPPMTLDADFERQWTAWKARGQAHERKVRRRLIRTAGVVVPVAALLYALFF